MWVKSYNQPGDSCEFFTSTFLVDSSILVVGERYYLSNGVGYNKPFIMKTDKNGNYKWHKYLYNSWNSYSMLPHKIVKLNDNSFVIGGVKMSSQNDGFILKTDTNGVLQFDVGTIGFPKSSVDDVIKLNDDTFLATGEFFTFGSYQRKMIYQFNGTNGNKIKGFPLNIDSKINGSSCVVQKSNGVIFLGGATGVPDGSYNYNADVLILNSNLDSLTTILFPMPSNSGLLPRSILGTKDGGFITTLFHLPNSGTPKNWLIKADSTGCFEVYCPINNGIEEAEKENGELKVWPNPADDKISFKLKNKNALHNLSFTLQDVLGNQLVSFDALSTSETQEMDLSILSKGIYFLRVESGSELLTVKKIIKN